MHMPQVPPEYREIAFPLDLSVQGFFLLTDQSPRHEIGFHGLVEVWLLRRVFSRWLFQLIGGRFCFGRGHHRRLLVVDLRLFFVECMCQRFTNGTCIVVKLPNLSSTGQSVYMAMASVVDRWKSVVLLLRIPVPHRYDFLRRVPSILREAFLWLNKLFL